VNTNFSKYVLYLSFKSIHVFITEVKKVWCSMGPSQSLDANTILVLKV